MFLRRKIAFGHAMALQVRSLQTGDGETVVWESEPKFNPSGFLSYALKARNNLPRLCLSISCIIGVSVPPRLPDASTGERGCRHMGDFCFPPAAATGKID